MTKLAVPSTLGGSLGEKGVMLQLWGDVELEAHSQSSPAPAEDRL